MKRREFVKDTAIATAAFSIIPSARLMANDEKRVKLL